MINLWGKPTSADRKEALQRLAEVECSAIALRPWQVLSQGERQRVLIARALMASPRILILDEPCSGLDPVAREHFLQFIQRLGSSKKAPSLVLVTHHVEEIMPVFTHALVLKKGQMLASGHKGSVLKSRILAETFETPMRLTRRNNRYQLSVQVTGKDVA